MRIELSDHKAYKWTHEQNIFYRGEMFFNNVLYKGDNLLNLLLQWNKEDFVSNVVASNGNFVIIAVFEDITYAFSDKIMSFPLLWCEHDNEVVLFDDIKKAPIELLLDDCGLAELAAFGYVLGNNTFYKGIYSVRGGEYLKIEKKSLSKLAYYRHLHSDEICYRTTEQWIKSLDSVVNSMFDRFVARLGGRDVILFLSGGYDSRLILINLLKRRYKNMICISLVASENDKDVIVAKKLQKQFNFTLLAVEYSKKYWKNKSKCFWFWDFVDNAMNGVGLHYLQGLVVHDLLQKGLVRKNSVVVTGNSGDVVEGNDVCDKFSKSNLYKKSDIVNEILNHHGVNIVNNSDIRCILSRHIAEILPCENDGMSFSVAQDMFEYFNWIERQCKYVTSDVRNYDDFIGVEWLLPLWDDEFVGFWQKVPIDLRYKRKLYYQYVEADNLPTANNMSMFLRIRNFIDKNISFILKFLYPFRQLFGYLSGDIAYSYYGVVNIKEYIYLQYKTFGNKKKLITPLLYRWFKYKYDKDIFSVVTDKS